MRIFLLLVGFFLSFRVGAQSPTHFTIGQEEFSATDVYSVLETTTGRFFAGTSTGLYEFKSGAFQSISHAKTHIGNSLFNLICDKKGDLFCGNLSGQIFKLEGDRLILFYTIPQQHIGTLFDFQFTSENDIIYASKNCVLLKNDQLEVLLNHRLDYDVFTLNHFKDDILIVDSYDDNAYVYTSKNGLSIHPISENTVLAPSLKLTRRVHYLENSAFSFYSNGKIIDEKKLLQSKVDVNQRETLKPGIDSDLWGINPYQGIRRIYMENGSLKQEIPIFTSIFVSCITFGKNGTMYLGTFNGGVIVVPNYRIFEHIPPENIKMTGIVATSEGVFISSRKSIYRYTTNFNEISLKSNQTFDKIFYQQEGNPLVVNQTYPGLVYDEAKMSGEYQAFGTIKDFCRVDGSTYLVAGSTGIFKLGNGLTGFPWKQDLSKSWKLSHLNERCNAVRSSSDGAYLLIATQSKLIKYYRNGKQENLKIAGKNIVCLNLHVYKGTTYIASLEFGILKLKNGKLTDFDEGKNRPNFNAVSKISVYQDVLYCSSDKGMHYYNFRTNEWREIGIPEGLMHGSVNDFSIYGNTLWVLSSGVPVSINMTEIRSEKPTFSLQFSKLYVNDEAVQISNKQPFSHTENRFLFKLDFRGIEYEDDVTILYRIKGLDSKWTSASIFDRIEYKSIPPGNYTFEVKAVYRSHIYPVIGYDFSIAKPFWLKLWFIVLVIIAVSLGVFILIRVKINQLKKKNLIQIQVVRNKFDLLESEMKALRSQMNPHFIFNSLNSIQDLILREDTDASYDYIVIFSDLIRNALNYSNKEFIPLDKEIQFLRSYLSLEKLRFSDGFTFSVTSEVEAEIEVSSMLVQPFVENALVHGLMHQAGSKTLSVHFAFGKFLECTIIDSGIGRKRAAEIKSRQGKNHDSFALSTIQKRLDLLKERHANDEAGFEVEDVLENEQIVGTKVVIRMPFQRKF